MTTGKFADELAAWVKKKPTKQPRQDRHVIAFLAVKEDVKSALDAGYSMKTIWEYMQETGRIATRYETFTLHVKRYIKNAPARQVRPQAASEPAPKGTSKSKTKSDAEKTAPTGIKGFNYNPQIDDSELF
ncbi:TraK family protein [Providencia rettgeri]|uniref:TraK family protein n=1 Tax=Shewanella TaxID=22 RepID=UPI001F1EF66C|nr:TraK family protein [Shewanella chilikensis]EJD6669369.1 TraK family protein [Providencia rettgeri]MCE9786489.1 TraK family protein [Shewanella chilikensis]